MELRPEVKALMQACQTLIESLDHNKLTLNNEERSAVLYCLNEVACQLKQDNP